MNRLNAPRRVSLEVPGPTGARAPWRGLATRWTAPIAALSLGLGGPTTGLLGAVGLVVGVGSMAAPTRAHAADPDRAAALEAEGKEAYREGDYLLAVQKFSEAYAAHPDPALRANQGLAYEALGEPARALEAYQAFLASNPPPEKAAKAKERVAALAPPVRVESEPPGAQIYLDDAPKPVGVTPATLNLVSGRHDLVLRKPGFAPEKLLVRVRTGVPTEARATLKPGGPVAAPRAPSITPEVLAPEVPVVSLGGGGPPTASWIAFGVGAAALAGVVGFQVVGRGAVDARDGAASAEAWEAWNDRVALHNTGFLVSAGVAAAAVGTGVTLWILDRRRAAPMEIPVTPVVAPGAAGLRWDLRF